MKIPAGRFPAISNAVGRLTGRGKPPTAGVAADAPVGAHPLGRGDSPDGAGSDTPSGGLRQTERPNRPAGKGRPTPKRSEAQRRRRGPAQAPANRKEAARRKREDAQARRLEAREGLRRGDDRYLPARDAGPVRRAIRDLVDSRRNVLSLFLVGAVVLFLGTLVRVPIVATIAVVLWFALLVAMVADSVWLGLLIRRIMRARFPDSRDRMAGLVFYGITRAMQMRRLRVPAPKVSARKVSAPKISAGRRS